MLLAEVVVHIVEVEAEQLHFAGRLVRGHIHDALQVEDLGQDAALSLVSAGFLQRLSLVLIEAGIQEELLSRVRHGGRTGTLVGSSPPCSLRLRVHLHLAVVVGQSWSCRSVNRFSSTTTVRG